MRPGCENILVILRKDDGFDDLTSLLLGEDAKFCRLERAGCVGPVYPHRSAATTLTEDKDDDCQALHGYHKPRLIFCRRQYRHRRAASAGASGAHHRQYAIVGLRRDIDGEDDLLVCAEADTARDARVALKERNPDVMIGTSDSIKATESSWVRDVRASLPEVADPRALESR